MNSQNTLFLVKYIVGEKLHGCDTIEKALDTILRVLRLETHLLDNLKTNEVAVAEAALVAPNYKCLVKIIHYSIEAILGNLDLVGYVSDHYLD